MGRPLYSRAFNTTPAVRDPEPPACERWSFLNAFDPDSDEFFDNENAVYEDFIGPVTPVSPEEEDEEERDMLVVRMGNASPIISESSSLSDSDSPLSVAAENPARLVDTFRDIRQIEEGDSESALVEPAVQVRLAGRHSTGTGSLPRRGFATMAAVRMSHRPYPQRDEILPVPTPSAPIPVPTFSRRSAVADDRVSPSPSTPPRQTPMAHLSMSPPPASTPRLYSWARNPTHAASPSSGGPFTNPHARTSYTHLSPVLIRIRDVTV